VRRLALVAGLALLAVAGWAAPASAHAALQSTEPPADAVLQKSPGSVVLHFDEDVEIQFGAVRVFNAGGRRVDTGSAYHPHGDGHAVATNVRATLAAGGYAVTWRVVSADSHPVHGAFTFQIGAAGTAAAAASKAQAARLLAAGGGSRTVGVVFGVIRFLSFGALFVLVGGAAFVAGAWPAGAAERRARRLLWAGLIAAVVTTVLAVCIQGPYGGGLRLSEMANPSVVSAVLHTRLGEVYLTRLVLLLVVAAPLLGVLLGARPLPSWWPPVAGLTGAAILVTPGLAGHAGTGSLVVLAIPLDLVHMAGGAVWVGGLAVVVVALLAGSADRDDRSRRTVLTRFSQWALVAVLAIAVSGGFAAWRQVGSWSAVTSTTFGRLLLAKTIIFAVLVAAASFSRRIVHGNLAVPFAAGAVGRPSSGSAGSNRALSPGPGAVAEARPRRGRPTGRAATVRRGPKRPPVAWTVRLRRTVLVELVLAAAILGVTAGLVNAQPARSALALPYATEVHAGNVLVDLIVDPARAGPVDVHLYTLRPDGEQLDVPEVDGAFSLPSAGIGNLTIPFEKAGPGHFLASGFDIPLRGTWKLDITVRTTNIDEFDATPIAVRIR
jgi:copper transport protein